MPFLSVSTRKFSLLTVPLDVCLKILEYVLIDSGYCKTQRSLKSKEKNEQTSGLTSHVISHCRGGFRSLATSNSPPFELLWSS